MNSASIAVLLVIVLTTSDRCSGQSYRDRRHQDNGNRYSNRYVTAATSRPSGPIRNKYGQEGIYKSLLSEKRREVVRPQDRIIFPTDVTTTTTADPRDTKPVKRKVNASNEIPLALYRRISNLNISDFLNNFVQEPPVILGVIDSSKSGRSSDDEVSSRDRIADEVPYAEPAVCTPQPTTVPIELTKEPYVLYFPSCTRMDRCGGCCSHELLECAATKRENVTLQVFKTRYLGPASNKFDVAIPVMVNLERHLQCECQCRIKLSDCRPYQVYRPNECRCECLNEDEAMSCVGEKFWDSSTCTCGCRQDLECSTGLYFNRETCLCELSRTNRMATPSRRFRDFSDEK